MQTTDVIIAIGTIVLAIVGIIAIFQDKIRAFFFRPKLEVNLIYAPPDCHKTKYHFSTNEETDAYYFRLRISNIGNLRAELVEVFACELTRKLVDGAYKPVNSFLPMNLVWSNIHQLFFPSISPGTYKHCDIAHIINPKKRYIDQLEDQTWTNVSPDDTILSFDTIVKPYTKNYLVCPGTYRLKITVAAANAKPIEKTLEITNSGHWYDEERQMLEEGISFKFI